MSLKADIYPWSAVCWSLWRTLQERSQGFAGGFRGGEKRLRESISTAPYASMHALRAITPSLRNWSKQGLYFDSDSDRMGWVFNQRPAVCSNRRLIGLLAQWFRPLPLKGTVISSQCWLVGLVTQIHKEQIVRKLLTLLFAAAHPQIPISSPPTT
ncbi:hypothetical protein TREMEDRAFT_59957 [Tremella mesenterica DSM 1558]|uniref:uncharacterized protein n=1 Tax=Tremella mesenterica (strain ATCC 24925 / CBS 8224 / DSM 1558 / NBRC 9311 / NRRL Y-6157 / RJB 2259-6 / UBC 559-6) TaxID=578456 RepID=UPI0003F494E4|nr:uncharacterized protein TREMEDRAFT_59957 [Tremella mesenterica DSM 1558]EIW71011.1 hypothetical protein TREMEDRAFT_59957 [Tremella mesenterica DSM 1558]